MIDSMTSFPHNRCVAQPATKQPHATKASEGGNRQTGVSVTARSWKQSGSVDILGWVWLWPDLVK